MRRRTPMCATRVTRQTDATGTWQRLLQVPQMPSAISCITARRRVALAAFSFARLVCGAVRHDDGVSRQEAMCVLAQ